MSLTTLPEIHEYTDRWCNEQRKRFKEEMIDIAKKEGIIKETKGNIKEVEVKVEHTLEELISKIFVEKIDYESEEVKEQNFANNLPREVSINIGKLAAGTYILNMTSGKGKSNQFRFQVVQE